MLRSFTAAALAASVLTLGVGCASSGPLDPGTTAEHPANPDARGTPTAPPSQTLAITDDAPAVTRPANDHSHAGPGGAAMSLPPLPGEDEHPNTHDMHQMHGGTMASPGDAGETTPPGRATVVPPTTTTAPAATQATVTYTCPMHPEVQAQAPGRCPICGMRLVERNADGGGQ